MRMFFGSFIILFALIMAANAQTDAKPDQPATEKKITTSGLKKVYELKLLSELCSLSPNDARCNRNIGLEMSKAFSEIIKNRVEVDELIGLARQSSLADLQMVVIAQNQRIIELLEELIKKK